MKIAIACSAGGHLTEILQLEPIFKKYEHFFITLKRSDSLELVKKREKVYFLPDFAKHYLNFFENLIKSFFIIMKERPNVIISTGASVVIPSIFIGKIFGVKIIFIETFARIYEPTKTGKIVYPIADLFLVQWPQLLRKYGRKAKYWGVIFG
ncbi:MAG: PssD/Cps14F family polysaccharide biosynthesis glycosyltransferase [Candidatus Aenigmatarchaeota archaeon]